MPPFNALLRLSYNNIGTSNNSTTGRDEFCLIRVNAKLEEPKLRYNMLKAVNYGDKDIDLIPVDMPDCDQVMVYAIPSLQSLPLESEPRVSEYKSANSRSPDCSHNESRTPSPTDLHRGVAIKKLQLKMSSE